MTGINYYEDKRSARSELRQTSSLHQLSPTCGALTTISHISGSIVFIGIEPFGVKITNFSSITNLSHFQKRCS